MPDINSLIALKAHYEREIPNSDAPALTDTNAAVGRLAHFLSEVPDRSIPLSNAKVDMKTGEEQLVFTGDANSFWEINSWGGEGITIKVIEILFTESSNEIVFDCKLYGNVDIGTETAPLKGELLENNDLHF